MDSVEAIERMATTLWDCGFRREIDDYLMKTQVWKGLTVRETIQCFLFTWFQDQTISYFQYRGALRLRADTFAAVDDSSSGAWNSRKRGLEVAKRQRQQYRTGLKTSYPRHCEQCESK